MTASIPPRRHPASISLGFGVFLMFLLAVPLSLVGNWRSQVLREHQAARRLRELGGVTDEINGTLEYKLNFALPEDCRRPIHIYGIQWWSPSSKDRGTPASSPLTNEVIQLLPQLHNLRVLCLSGARQPGVSFAPLSRLSQLRYLTLACQATDEDVLCFLSQRQLINLDLNGQPITDACLVVAERNPNLTHLDLSETAITDEGLRTLSKLQQLQVLKLRRTRITSAGLQHLQGLKDLCHLNLEGTAIDDSAIQLLVEWRSLRGMNVRGTQLTPQGVDELRSRLPECSFWFDWNRKS